VEKILNESAHFCSLRITKFFHLNILAFVGLLWLLAAVFFVYHRLRDFPPRNTADLIFVNAPFSIYAAFTFFAALFQTFWFSEVTRTHPVVKYHLTIFCHD
jgi:hypothetical protein